MPATETEGIIFMDPKQNESPEIYMGKKIQSLRKTEGISSENTCSISTYVRQPLNAGANIHGLIY